MSAKSFECVWASEASMPIFFSTVSGSSPSIVAVTYEPLRWLSLHLSAPTWLDLLVGTGWCHCLSGWFC